MPLFRFLGTPLLVSIGVMLALTVAGQAEARCAGQAGIASWYGGAFHGRRTASGERFNQNAMTAAMWGPKFGAKYRVTHRGRSVIVRINDRGPAKHLGRSIDLSVAAATRLGFVKIGVGRVCLTPVN